MGGYSCRCRSGFRGNGYTCYEETVVSEPVTEPEPEPSPEPSFETTEEPSTSSAPIDSTPNIPGLAPEHWLCDQCSEHADCVQGVCICRNGWNGDGIECVYNCQDDSVWTIDRCIPINSDEEESNFLKKVILKKC